MKHSYFYFSLFQAEQDLKMTQSEFDRQAEITRLLLEGISSTHVSSCLKTCRPLGRLPIHISQPLGFTQRLTYNKPYYLSPNLLSLRPIISAV